ncbi:hypothetical protein J6590_031266 [Homalodisca vitripennis]|nr:hypothetical protein J6590_031266 [Homalodisca vitripennis]
MPVLCGTKRAGPDRQACYRRPGALQPVKTDKFIECVHGIPALWDKSAAEYSDKNIRDRAWIEIGIAMYED